MPAGPVGSVWAAGTWPDTVWEAGSWGAAVPSTQVELQDYIQVEAVDRWVIVDSVDRWITVEGRE